MSELEEEKILSPSRRIPNIDLTDEEKEKYKILENMLETKPINLNLLRELWVIFMIIEYLYN